MLGLCALSSHANMAQDNVQQKQLYSSVGFGNLHIPAGRAPCSQACEFLTLHPHSSRLLKSALCLLGWCVKEAKGSAARQLIKWPTSTFDLGENSPDNIKRRNWETVAEKWRGRERRNGAGERREKESGKGKRECVVAKEWVFQKESPAITL